MSLEWLPFKKEKGTKQGSDTAAPFELQPSGATRDTASMVVDVPTAISETPSDESVGAMLVTGSKTTEERGWGLSYFALATLVFFLAAAAALSWNWRYVNRFLEFDPSVALWVWPAFPFPAAPGAILATIYIVILGTAAYKCLFPGRTDSWEAIGFVLGLGIGLTGLTGTILALIGRFTFPWIFGVMLAEVVAFVLLYVVQREPGPVTLFPWRSVARIRWPNLKRIEWLGVGGIAFVAALVVYQATFYPIVETDALIYHAPLAALVYYHGGLPWIVGGGVGLGSSANYPQLYSLLGAYYYVWTGGVHDVYLRLIGAASWGLVVYATFLIGRRLAGRSHGLLAAVLAASVPSFVSYAFLATQETTLVMFGALGFLALLKSTDPRNLRYGLLSGLFLGSAALTSYQGLYFVLPIVALYALSVLQRRDLRWGALRHPEPLLFLFVLLVAAVAGSASYVRNWILLGDPIYPFYSSLFPSPYLSATTMGYAEQEWRSVAQTLAMFGPSGGTYLDFLYQFGTHPSFAPLSLAFAIPAFLILPGTRIRRSRELACFYFVVLAAIFAGPIPFIRYAWLLIPFAAVAVSAGAMAALHALRAWASSEKRSRPARIATEAVGRVPVLVLASLFILPIVVGFGGNAYFFGTNNVGKQYFRYFDEPGIDIWEYVKHSYGSDTQAWQWFNGHLQPGQRIASLEYRVYYIDNAMKVPDTMLYLDTQEAEPLYSMQDPADMAAYLQAHRVSYVFIRSSDWKGFTSAALPLFRWLGSPYFPWAAVFGKSVVFDVGIQPYPNVPPGNPIGLYGIAGLIDPEGFLGKRVLRIPEDNITPRVSVFSRPEPQVLVIRYWDSGQGTLDVNGRRFADNTWYLLDRSLKGNTSTWHTAAFVVPNIPGQAVLEFGLHASGSDFIVDDIEVKTVQEPWFLAFGNQGNATFPSNTTPPAVFVYLPFLLSGQRLTVTATAGGRNLSVEVFRHLILPELRTGWWLEYSSAARSPSLQQFRSPNPRIDFTISASGTYTLIIVLRSPWQAGIMPDVQIVIR